jgi:hypothetical protein
MLFAAEILMNITPSYFYLICAFCTVLTNVNAAVQKIDKDASTLVMSTSLAYTDDINPTIEPELASAGIILAPKGQLVMSLEGAQFLMGYSADIARYKLSDTSSLLDDQQDFDTFSLKLLSRFFIGQAWHIDAQFQHKNETQRYGEGISQLRSDVFVADQSKQNTAQVSLVYGRDTESRYISMNVFSNQINYESNNDYSTFFDVSEQGLEFDVAFKRSESSSYLVRLKATEEDYAVVSRDDSHVYQALLGLNWQPSGKTKLDALVGMYSRESDTNDSSSGLSWAIDFSTQPTDQWLWEVSSARFSGVSKSELTSSSVEQNAQVAVSYKISERWQIGLNASKASVEFDDEGVLSTLDEMRAGMNLSLVLKQHSKVSLSLGINEQTYPAAIVDYSQNEARLTWQVSL